LGQGPLVVIEEHIGLTQPTHGTASFRAIDADGNSVFDVVGQEVEPFAEKIVIEEVSLLEIEVLDVRSE